MICGFWRYATFFLESFDLEMGGTRVGGFLERVRAEGGGGRGWSAGTNALCCCKTRGGFRCWWRCRVVDSSLLTPIPSSRLFRPCFSCLSLVLSLCCRLRTLLL